MKHRSILQLAAFIGLAGFLVLAIIFWILGVARTKFASARYADKHTDSAPVNPLVGRYERQRIRLADFFHPFYRPIEDANFERCELLGPAHLVFIGNSIFTNSHFYDCEVVIVKKDAIVRGVTGFKDCRIDKCSLFRLTLYMPKDAYIEMKAALGGKGPSVISDGTAGNL